MSRWKWITPLMKQTFVTLGVVMNMANFGTVMGYTASLLPQLRQPGSIIVIDDSSGSWIAAILGPAMIPATFVSALIMGKLGRRTANIVSLIPCIIGWIVIVFATNLTSLLIARCLQGFTLGMVSNVAPVLIGEYTSPVNRGAFLSTLSLAVCIGTLLAHAFGLYLPWKVTALIFAVLSFINLIIVILSPESPSWLIDRGRYEEGKRNFKWLRGDKEDKELKEMIAADIALKNSYKDEEYKTINEVIRAKLKYCKAAVKKKEFYKPVMLVTSLYTLTYWAGAPLYSSYSVEMAQSLTSKDTDANAVIISLGIQRIFSATLAIYLVKRFKRKPLLLGGGAIAVLFMVLSAIYLYFKEHNLLPFDHVSIGIILLHVFIFSVAVSTVTLPLIIAGELYPLEYRSVSSSISVMTITPNMVLVLKSFPLLLNSVGFCGTYLLYGVITSCCLLFSWRFLPETKDRTLQDIENEFRGISTRDVMAVQPLALNDVKNIK